MLVPRQSAQPPDKIIRDDVVVIQVLADGRLRINQEPVSWDRLGNRIEDVFKQRATRLSVAMERSNFVWWPR